MKSPFYQNRNQSLPLLVLCSTAAASAQLVWNPATVEAVPEVISAERMAAGFKLEICAPPGEYVLRRSTTLLPDSWQPIGVLEPVDGLAAATDAEALSLTSAFYRVEGTFSEMPQKLIGFETGIASAGVVPNALGGLWTGHAHQDFLFQRRAGSDAALAKFSGERFTSFRIEPTNLGGGTISASIKSGDEVDLIPIEVDADRWVVTADVGDVPLFKLEGGDHSLIGIFRDSESNDSPTPFGTYSSTEEAISTLWTISKSTAANPTDLAGDWGFVRIMVNGVSSDGIYSGLAFTTSITAGPNPRPISISSVTEFEIEHIWPNSDVEWSFSSEVFNPPITTSLILAADGGVSIPDPEDGPDFLGMASPSARLVVATKSTPDLPAPGAGEVDEFLPNLDEAAVQWLVGVKRTNTPQLAGKTYRIIRQGWWVDGDEFEIDAGSETDRLVFNAAGTSVTRTSSFAYEAVSFDGVMDSGSETIVQPMSVNVDVEGKITLEGGVVDDYNIRSFGFAQEGSKLLVLIDAIATEEEGAGLGLIVAIEEP